VRGWLGWRAAFALFSGAAIACAACSAWLGLEPLEYDVVPDAGSDVVEDRGLSTDASPEATLEQPPDAAEGGIAPGPPFDDMSRWTTYAGNGDGWYAATFDGRYVYFTRIAGPPRIVRYDTQAENAFDQASSWTAFDPTTIVSITQQYALAFDGRYLVVAPYAGVDGGIATELVRFDTTSGAAFDSPSSWETLDGATVAAGTSRYTSGIGFGDASYFGAASANRPFLKHAGGGAAFDAGWEVMNPTFDAAACNRNLFGAACAGGHLYFGPGNNGSQGDSIVRYDPTTAFDAQAGWECFSLATFGLDFSGYQGAAADGSHAYFTDFGKGLLEAGAPLPRRIARHDATKSLDQGWEFYVVTKAHPLASRYHGGTFDGRFVYFAPFPDNSNTVYLRYDTMRSFGDDNAWQAVTNGQLGLLDATHAGAVFDGKYVYYGHRIGRAARYRARDDRVYVASCSGF